MNKRLHKKMERRRRDDLHRILDLVLDINGLEPREQEISGSLPTAFLSFSGHVGTMRVDLHNKGWFRNSLADKKIEMHTYRPDEVKRAIRNLEQVKKEVLNHG